MSILRPVAIFLRNALVKQHPYFSCCASCGEIKTPLEGRLCASLSCSFQVDAVVLASSEEHDEARIRRVLDALDKHCPWLRRIFLIKSGASSFAFINSERVATLAADDFTPGDSPFGPAAHVHEAPGLGEYYLVLSPEQAPVRNLLPLDFYTPNGIPLLPLEREGESAGGDASRIVRPAPGILAQTKENSVDFLATRKERPGGASGDYRSESGLWAYAAARVVPSCARCDC